MLDLLISFINFIILSIPYAVKKFTFLPPNPPKYIIVKEKMNRGKKIKEKEEIHFLLKTENGSIQYKKLKPKILNIKYSKITKDNYDLPILIITPIYSKDLCIIYCQGNNGDLGSSLFECFEISLKCNSMIVTFEYPGYGLCKDEEIKESEFFKRIKIVYNHIINFLNFRPNQIILYGFSLGSGIAFDLACRKEFPVAGLILQSPFLSIIRTRYNTKTTKYFDLFNNCDKAKNLCTQTLFIHGNNDTIVPYIHGRILSELIPKKYFYDFLTVDNANHNNLIKNNKDFVFKYIKQFISFCVEDYSNSDYINEIIENNDLTEENRRKKSDLINFIKKEDYGLDKSKEIKKRVYPFEDRQILEKNLKASSCINCPIQNIIKLAKENNNQNNNFEINNKSLNVKYLENVKQKIFNYSNNYYYVNVGAYSKNKKFSVYNNFCKIYNNNKKNKNLTKEKSMTSLFSSNNNIKIYNN